MPTIAADDVLVRSRNVGICHSDFELYEGRYIIPVSYPIIPGHEWSGEVAEAGSGVGGLAPAIASSGNVSSNNGDDHFGFSISGADAEYFGARRPGCTAAGGALVHTGRVRRAVLGRVQRRRRLPTGSTRATRSP